MSNWSVGIAMIRSGNWYAGIIHIIWNYLVWWGSPVALYVILSSEYPHGLALALAAIVAAILLPFRFAGFYKNLLPILAKAFGIITGIVLGLFLNIAVVGISLIFLGIIPAAFVVLLGLATIGSLLPVYLYTSVVIGSFLTVVVTVKNRRKILSTF